MFSAAKHLNDPCGAYNLGSCLYEGFGLPSDKEKASEAYFECIKKGYRKLDAKRDLDNYYESNKKFR